MRIADFPKSEAEKFVVGRAIQRKKEAHNSKWTKIHVLRGGTAVMSLLDDQDHLSFLRAVFGHLHLSIKIPSFTLLFYNFEGTFVFLDSLLVQIDHSR